MKSTEVVVDVSFDMLPLAPFVWLLCVIPRSTKFLLMIYESGRYYQGHSYCRQGK
jgi:hypothetical protein